MTREAPVLYADAAGRYQVFVERLGMALPDGRTLSALRYAPDGTAAGPVVTFLHGAGLNAHTWDTTILALGLPALAIDLPGHGDSSWRDDAAYVARVLAPDVAAGIDAWTDGPQLLVGQSLGGLTAAAVAASRPDLVRELVVIDITPGIDSERRTDADPRLLRGPDRLGHRVTSWSTARWPFGLGGSRRAAERGVYLNSRIRPDGRVEWKHHFAHLAAAMSAAPPTRPRAAAPSQDALAARALRGRVGRPRRRAPRRSRSCAATAAMSPEADAAEFRERVPAASVVTRRSGHNVQEELPVDLGARLRSLAGKG